MLLCQQGLGVQLPPGWTHRVEQLRERLSGVPLNQERAAARRVTDAAGGSVHLGAGRHRVAEVLSVTPTRPFGRETRTGASPSRTCPQAMHRVALARAACAAAGRSGAWGCSVCQTMSGRSPDQQPGRGHAQRRWIRALGPQARVPATGGARSDGGEPLCVPAATLALAPPTRPRQKRFPLCSATREEVDTRACAARRLAVCAAGGFLGRSSAETPLWCRRHGGRGCAGRGRGGGPHG